jgi:hypothetical protein
MGVIVPEVLDYVPGEKYVIDFMEGVETSLKNDTEQQKHVWTFGHDLYWGAVNGGRYRPFSAIGVC